MNLLILQNNSLIEIINTNEELLKKEEIVNSFLYDTWQDIFTNEFINDGIKKLDELLKFFKSVLNSIFFIKNKIKNTRDEKSKEKHIKKLEKYINITNLNNFKEGIISSDVNESYLEELNNYRKKINEIDKEINNIINEEKLNQKEKKACYVNEISKYLLNQKKYIFKFIEIIENSVSFIDSLQKEILNQKKNIHNFNYINNNNNYNNNISSEKSIEEEENEEEEEEI